MGGGRTPPFREQGPIARNEEFSEIAVINIFLQFSKKNQLSVGGGRTPPFREQGPIARNEEFSEIAVINIFLQFSKKKQLSVGGGGPAGKISR